jgi:hypothetical protein
MIKRYRAKERVIIYARANMKSIIYSQKKPNGWVKPGFVTALTDWDGEKLRQAREQKLIEWEDRADGRYYNLDSIHEKFFKK